MQHPRPRSGARGKTGKLLAGNCPLLASASPKINRPSTMVLERPRSPYPLFWKPNLCGAALSLAGLCGAS